MKASKVLATFWLMHQLMYKMSIEKAFAAQPATTLYGALADPGRAPSRTIRSKGTSR
jgi:hypothetical protein